MGFRHGVLLSLCCGLGTPAWSLLAHGLASPLAPTPVVGRVDQRSAHHTRHLRAEEVARPWTARPGNRAIKGLAVRRPRDQARNSGPIGMAHPGNPVGAT
jgi:hypothetical protein